jgi:hypothetical protein
MVKTSLTTQAGKIIKTASSGIVDFGGAVLGVGAPKLNADGDSSPTPSNYPAPNLRKNSLIVRIGDRWYQGGTNTTFTTATSGQIYLGLNDNNVDDNSQAWKVYVYEVSAPPPLPIACQPIAKQLQVIENELKKLQLSLAGAAGAQKAAIVEAIQEKTQERDQVKKQFDNCLIQHKNG